MRSDRLLHSETVQFEPSCFVVFPAQRSLNSTRSPFGSRAADSLSSRGSRLVLVHASSVRVPPVRPKTIGAGNGGLGAARCYEAGGVAFHGATPTSALTRVHARRRCLPPSVTVMRASGISVASSVPARPPQGLRGEARRCEGRQDWFRGGLVKGVRFPGPRCLPSAVASLTALAPRCGARSRAFVDRGALT